MNCLKKIKIKNNNFIKVKKKKIGKYIFQFFIVVYSIFLVPRSSTVIITFLLL